MSNISDVWVGSQLIEKSWTAVTAFALWTQLDTWINDDPENRCGVKLPVDDSTREPHVHVEN